MILLYDITWHVNPENFTDLSGTQHVSCLFSMFQRHPTSTRLFRLHAATQGDKAAIFCESHNDQARQLEDVSETWTWRRHRMARGNWEFCSFQGRSLVVAWWHVMAHMSWHRWLDDVGWFAIQLAWMTFFVPNSPMHNVLSLESLANAPCNGSSINICLPIAQVHSEFVQNG